MFNFDKMTERRHTNSLKWDVAEDVLPMWVADMDFETAPAVSEAVKARAAHPIYGYSIIPDEWAEAYIHWFKTRHHLNISPNELIFCTGVVPAISTAVRKFTTPADRIIILSPVYNIFYNCIVNNGRVVIDCDLNYTNGEYNIDFDLLESYMKDPQASMLILCNPHNPVGKIWTRQTLARLGALCKKYDLLVVSDEIHCDLTDPGKEYVPFASVDDNCANNSITCFAPSKTFNIAGLNSAAVYIPNENIRRRMNRALNTDEVAEPNAFAIQAAIAAYTEGAPWLDELRAYLYENKSIFVKTVNDLFEVNAVPSEATYLSWIDCRGLIRNIAASYLRSSAGIADYIRMNSGLYITRGSAYGTAGEGFLRVNIACPRMRLMDGLERLSKCLKYLYVCE